MTSGAFAKLRPVLGIVHGEGSVSAMDLADTAEGVCDVVWIVDSNDLEEAWILQLLRKLGPTVDVAGTSLHEAGEALRSFGLDGIVSYSDRQMPLATLLAERLQLDYHDEAVVSRLLDKLNQRQALRDAGLPVPRIVPVPTDPTPGEVDALAAEVGFPLVVKPRHGTASRDTVLVGDLPCLRDLLTGHVASDGTVNEPMVLEEYIAGASSSVSPLFADYVSVESVLCGGHISHVVVSGRPPLAQTFRETGLIIPSDLPPPAMESVLDVATRAITALGVRTGCLHTEVKLTPHGPRIIEVNGRLGGFVPAVLKRVVPAVDLLEVSLRVATGESVVFDEVLVPERVGYFLCVQPPQWAKHVVAIEGLEQLELLEGIEAVFVNRGPGDLVDWRRGSLDFVLSVLGTAPDHFAVSRTQRFIEESVTVTYA